MSQITETTNEKTYLCPFKETPVKEEQVNWYAVKVFYNKVFELEALLEGMGLETYLAVSQIRLKGEEHMRIARRLATPDDRRIDNQYIQIGPVIYRRDPLVSSLIFVRCGHRTINQVRKAIDGKGFVYLTPDRRKASPIPDREMTMFRLAVNSGMTGLGFYSDEEFTRYRTGDRVRVKEGPLAGLEGYIKRIKKDRRLLVSVEGVIAVAMSYIPFQNLEKVPEPSTSAS